MPAFRKGRAAVGRLAGWLGRFCLTRLYRLIDQAGFAGRMLALNRQGLVFHLILNEIYKLISVTLPLLLTIGFITGLAWALVWLIGPLSALGGGLESLTSSLITINILVNTPIIVTVIVILSYGAPVTWELATLKAIGRFEILTREGRPPEIYLAAPCIGAVVLTMPVLLAIFVAASLAGTYLLIWQYTGQSILAFIIALNSTTRINFLAVLALKSLAISLSLSFFCVYNGFRAKTKWPNSNAATLSHALTESFFFSILSSLLITVFFNTAP